MSSKLVARFFVSIALVLGAAHATLAGPACEECDDGVPDVIDNCDHVANDPPLDCDTDSDGYGNICDADLNNNGSVNIQDFAIWRAAFQDPGSNLAADHDCSGAVTIQDFSRWRQIFQDPSLFSSGLPCAGTIPCP